MIGLHSSSHDAYACGLIGIKALQSDQMTSRLLNPIHEE